MNFDAYTHIERFGRDETEGITKGKVYLFSKIDGTNSSLWIGVDGLLKGGSRRRELSLHDDNAGFYAYAQNDSRYVNFFKKYPKYRLYGEWLVKHTIKDYRDDAWGEFYVFDVVTEDGSYIRYEDYVPLLEEFNISYVPTIAILENPTDEEILSYLPKASFLMKEGYEENGEGLVIKNYDFVNRYGRKAFAKIVREEFKAKHRPVKNRNEEKESIEQRIVDRFLTDAFVEKEYQKIVQEHGGFHSKLIGRFLGQVWHEFVVEEIWDILKKMKNPTINFKTLNICVNNRVKEIKSELF